MEPLRSFSHRLCLGRSKGSLEPRSAGDGRGTFWWRERNSRIMKKPILFWCCIHGYWTVHRSKPTFSIRTPHRLFHVGSDTDRVCKKETLNFVTRDRAEKPTRCTKNSCLMLPWKRVELTDWHMTEGGRPKSWLGLTLAAQVVLGAEL